MDAFTESWSTAIVEQLADKGGMRTACAIAAEAINENPGAYNVETWATVRRAVVAVGLSSHYARLLDDVADQVYGADRQVDDVDVTGGRL